MDGTQQQLINLNRKVEQLYDMVERMNYQITALMSTKQASREEKQQYRAETDTWMISDSNSGSYSLGMMDHKDILQDETHQNSMTNSGNDANWSTDIQIRRLTAQLTAAYHRIAALEEQLLSHRIHS
ncbi:hypothetical protein [Chroococcus sp. FPU101]|uniref:hypothetical protein n=1 Tax=Chroococcus sp. FPU101 TaxID=1974212 RepID=UPI001A90119B|nr:hypothetical protein [Chroococcus sp. FPU101]GFE69993.1 hypothetical protein CFPU101_26030 [Chroococcus sp. FPU101]